MRLVHAVRGLALLAAALALSGCEGLPGAKPGVTARLTTVPVINAGGRQVKIATPEGFCVDSDAVKPNQASAFVLVEDCALRASARELEEENAYSGQAIARPALINGLVMLSIGASPLFEGGTAQRDEDFAALDKFLRSDAGRASAGLGGDAASIRIIETRRVGDALYVLIEDRGAQVMPVLGDRFWRGFTEVNDRAVIASLGVFDTSTLGDGAKLGHLARVVAALKEGNGDPVDPAELALAATAPVTSPLPHRKPEGVARIAAASGAESGAATGSGSGDGDGSASEENDEGADASPAAGPLEEVPAGVSTAAAEVPSLGAASDSDSRLAPRRAPAAPRRPRA